MHEMSIAMSMLEQVRGIAEREGASAVVAVEVELGAMQRVVPEALKMAWLAAREGTVASRAVLRMTEIRAEAECRRCGARFEPEIDFSFMCPACAQADVRIVSGDDIILKSVVCETPDAVKSE